MFLHLILLAGLAPVVYLWCTPFIACNQTVYGDFSDIEKGMKVILLGRPFQKMDQLIITGEYYNNGSEVMDDAAFTVGLSKGLIMHQLGMDDLEQYLLTTTLGASEERMNISGKLLGRKKDTFLIVEKAKPNVTCADPFTFVIKSQDGYGFAFGSVQSSELKYTAQVALQYPKNEQSQSVFFDGKIKTSKIEFKCLDS